MAKSFFGPQGRNQQRKAEIEAANSYNKDEAAFQGIATDVASGKSKPLFDQLKVQV